MARAGGEMQWATRVRPWRIRRLYKLASSSIYDDDLLLEVGWGLYARGEDVLTVARAMRGEVPCPQCGETVYRPKFQSAQQFRRARASLPRFACAACGRRLTWQDCREALRNHPRCFECLRRLDVDFAANRLTCSRCGAEWSWKRYRQSLSRRTRLPCPHCDSVIRRPREARATDGGSSRREEVACPKCQGRAVHANGKITCPTCGYEQAWRVYRKRMKRRVEHLRCGSCGHEFTWQAWRRHYQRRPLTTGNTTPVEKFLSKWPRCQTPQEQLLEIDALVHALHGRGALAPVFIEGTAASVSELLNGLAGQT